MCCPVCCPVLPTARRLIRKRATCRALDMGPNSNQGPTDCELDAAISVYLGTDPSLR
jgi:hypothetical protein